MVKINKRQHITKKGVVKKNPETKPKSKIITIKRRDFYNRSEKPMITKERMTKDQFDKEVRFWENKGFEIGDADYEDGILEYYYD